MLLVLGPAWRSVGLLTVDGGWGTAQCVSLPCLFFSALLCLASAPAPISASCYTLTPWCAHTLGGKILEPPSNDQGSKRHLWLLLP